MRNTLLWTLLCLTFSLSAWAQKVPASYQLAPEDAITIQVMRHPEFSGEFLIPPDGVIDVPAVGKVTVTGRTVADLTQYVLDHLRDRLLAPEVTISLRVARMQRIYVFGAVTRPGIYDMQPTWRITEALAAAGGLSVPPQDCSATLLRAATGKSLTLSIPDILAAKTDANVLLESGDVFTVNPRELALVYVTGAAVHSSGPLQLPAGSGIQEAVAQAGGLLLSVDEVEAVLKRGGVDTPVNLKTGANLPLQRGDMLSLNPARHLRVMVNGAVQHPAFYDLKVDEGAQEALTLAGGPSGDPAESTVTLTRGAEKQTLPLSAVYGANPTQKLALQAGDYLSVEVTALLPVFIAGQVKTPGLLMLRAGLGVQEALAQAGGLTAQPGDLRVTLTRGGRSTLVDLAGAGVPLQRGDVLTVDPLRSLHILVTGKVVKPGMYDLQPSESLMEALTMAGGTTSEPADSTVTLVRGDERHAIPVTAVYASDPTAKLTLRTADTLTVDSVELLPVYVTGMAHTPGLQMLRAGAGALEALAQAGGLAIPESDARAAIVRGGHEVQVVDLRAAARKVAGANAPLQRGDVLAITSLRTVRVMVTGKVKQPGFCDLTPGEGLIEALTLAGGALPEAALGHVRLTHTSGATEVINMAAAFQEGKKQVNVTLSDGDLVVVPEFSRAVAVLGYVQSPGYYPLVEGKILTISDAIGLAKGPENRRGGINRVAVMSVADDGTQTRKIVNLDKYFKTGDAQYNPEVKAGDIIYVPETAKPDWTAVFQSLANLATVSIAAKQF